MPESTASSPTSRRAYALWWSATAGADSAVVLLVLVGAVRELFGAGTLLGYQVFALAAEGGWFQPVGLMRTPPSAFFVIGFLIWALRSWKTEQVEARELGIEPLPVGGGRR